MEYVRLTIEEALVKRIDIEKISAEDVLGLARDAQLLNYNVSGTHIRTPIVRFHHLLLQQFFTALALGAEANLCDVQHIQRYIKNVKWWDVILMLDNLLEDKGEPNRFSQHRQLLESIINAHPEGWTWFLAGSLLWRVDEFIDPELYNSLIDSIAQGILDTVREEHRQAVSQLSMVAPKQLIHIVKELLKRQDSKLTDTVAILVRGVIEDGIRHRTVVPFLLTALDLVYISDFVVNVTSTIGEPVVLPLIDVVKLGTTTAKIAAAQALGVIRDDRATEVLIDLLDTYDDLPSQFEGAERDVDLQIPSATVQFLRINGKITIAKALGQIGNPHAIEAIIRAMRGENPIFQKALTEAVGYFGERAIPELVTMLIEDTPFVSQEAEKTLLSIGSTAVDILIEAMSRKRREARRKVMRLLGKIGDERAILHLVPMLKSPNILDRRDAIKALGSIGGAAIPPLIEALKTTPDRFTHIYLVEELGKAGSTAVPYLLEVTTLPSKEARRGAVEALGHIRDSAAVNHLVTLMSDDPDILVRCAAAIALGRIGDTNVIPHLENLLQQELQADQVTDIIILLAALAQLGIPKHRDYLLDFLRIDVEEWEQLSELERAQTVFIAQLLTDMREERAIPYLEQIIEKCRQSSDRTLRSDAKFYETLLEMFRLQAEEDRLGQETAEDEEEDIS